MPEELTGRRRYRRLGPRWAQVEPGLLLQVEVSVWASSREDKPGRWVCQWRDATPKDVNESELV